MKRWPIIRHVRWLYLMYQVKRHYDIWRHLGYVPVHVDSDLAVLDRIWNGEL